MPELLSTGRTLTGLTGWHPDDLRLPAGTVTRVCFLSYCLRVSGNSRGLRPRWMTELPSLQGLGGSGVGVGFAKALEFVCLFFGKSTVNAPLEQGLLSPGLFCLRFPGTPLGSPGVNFDLPGIT